MIDGGGINMEFEIDLSIDQRIYSAQKYPIQYNIKFGLNKDELKELIQVINKITDFNLTFKE